MHGRGKQTFDEMGDETHFTASKHIAFASNTDCSQDIVASAHHITNASFIQLINDTGSAGLQFILEDDEP
jgi:hypothetical protein